MKKQLSFLFLPLIFLGQAVNSVNAWVNITEDWDEVQNKWSEDVRDSHSFKYNGYNYIALGYHDPDPFNAPTISAFSIRKDMNADRKFHLWEEVIKVDLSGIISNAGAPAVKLETNGDVTVIFTSFAHHNSKLYHMKVNLNSNNIIQSPVELSFRNYPDGSNNNATAANLGLTDPFIWTHNNKTYLMAVRWLYDGRPGSQLVWSVQNTDGTWAIPWEVYMQTTVNNQTKSYLVDRPDLKPGDNPYMPDPWSSPFYTSVIHYDSVVEAPYVQVSSTGNAYAGSKVLWSVGWSDLVGWQLDNNGNPILVSIPSDRNWQGIRCGTLQYFYAAYPNNYGYPYIVTAKPLQIQSDIQVSTSDTFYTHADLNPDTYQVRATSRRSQYGYPPHAPIPPTNISIPSNNVNIVDTGLSCY